MREPERAALVQNRIASLLSTCRLGYVEALPMLYSTCTLATRDPAVILYLDAVLPQSHLEGMRIDLTWNVFEPPNYKDTSKPFRNKNKLWREIRPQ